MMYRGARAARKTLRFVHVCTYIDASEPVRSTHGIHKLTLYRYPAAHTQSTNVCTSMRPVTAVYAVISPFIFRVRNTCVFIAISARLMPYSWQETGTTMSWKKYLVSFFTGRDKELISRAILETRQLYYLYVCRNTMIPFLLTCSN